MHLHSVIIAFKPAPRKTFDAFLRFSADGQIGNPGLRGCYDFARTGALKGLTGVDDPYEVPKDPSLVLTTVDCGPEANAEQLIHYLS